MRTLSICLLASLALPACKGDDTGNKAQSFCHDIIQEGCVRAFECIPPANRTAMFTQTYGTSQQRCQATPDNCANYPATCPNYDRDAGATCLSAFTDAPCADLLFVDNGDPTIGLPPLCATVCPP